MVKARGPAFSSDAQGSIGKSLTFFNWKGIHRIRKHFTPKNPKTTIQQLQRSFLSMAILAWRNLSAADKILWGNLVKEKNLAMSGYNYFISDYINTMLIPPPPPGPITDGLISWWKFDEGEGVTANDSWGTNHGSLNGCTWVDGKINKCLQFNGTTDFVNYPTNGFPFGNSPRTLEAWFRQTHDYGSWSFWFSYGKNSIKNAYWTQMAWSADYMGIDAHSYGGHYVAPYNLNEWYHLVYTFDGSDMRIYLNSDLKKTFDWSEINTISSSMHYIGKSDLGYFHPGLLDEIRFYDKALNQEEIDNNYNLT